MSESSGLSFDFCCFSAESAWKMAIKKPAPFDRNRLVFYKSDISYLQERKSAKARAHSVKIRNARNQAIKQPRVQGRNSAMGVRQKKFLDFCLNLWYNGKKTIRRGNNVQSFTAEA